MFVYMFMRCMYAFDILHQMNRNICMKGIARLCCPALYFKQKQNNNSKKMLQNSVYICLFVVCLFLLRMRSISPNSFYFIQNVDGYAIIYLFFFFRLSLSVDLFETFLPWIQLN